MTSQQAEDVRLILDAIDKATLTLSRYVEPGGAYAKSTVASLLSTLDGDTLFAARKRLEQDVDP